MKKVLFLMLFLTIAGIASMNAQVRIGGNLDPSQEAVLDLNANNDPTPAGNKGALALPRVSLSNDVAKLNGGTPLNGMMVYNTNASMTGGSGVGIYYCNVGKWTKLGGLDVASNGLTKSDNTTVSLGGTLTKNTEFVTAGYNLYTTGTGKFSVGAQPNATSAKFEVNGAAANTAAFNAGTSRTINFSNSNLAYTTAMAGAFSLSYLKDGATYTLAVQGTTSAKSTFTARNTANATLTVKIVNDVATTAGKHTLYTIIVMGTTAYVFVNPGF